MPMHQTMSKRMIKRLKTNDPEDFVKDQLSRRVDEIYKSVLKMSKSPGEFYIELRETLYNYVQGVKKIIQRLLKTLPKYKNNFLIYDTNLTKFICLVILGDIDMTHYSSNPMDLYKFLMQHVINGRIKFYLTRNGKMIPSRDKFGNEIKQNASRYVFGIIDHIALVEEWWTKNDPRRTRAIVGYSAEHVLCTIDTFNAHREYAKLSDKKFKNNVITDLKDSGLNWEDFMKIYEQDKLHTNEFVDDQVFFCISRHRLCTSVSL